MKPRFFTDPARFLEHAGAFLASDPVRYSVIASVAAQHASRGMPVGPLWFATVDGPDGVAGVAMRTHPDPPHAGFISAMPEACVDALAEALAARGEAVLHWNGDLAGGLRLAQSAAGDREVRVVEHLRLFELRSVLWPQRPEGTLRQAGLDDLGLVAGWMAAFHHDADIQGGRVPAEAPIPDPEAHRANLADGRFWLWEVAGRPVHLSGLNAPACGAARIGPVYTPAEHRGRGYAAWIVASLSQRALDAGARPCLYTDQANPVSNKIYERIGYQARGDEGVVRTIG